MARLCARLTVPARWGSLVRGSSVWPLRGS
jgi:hypothetical protein